MSTSKKMFSFRARVEKGIARHIDASSVVGTSNFWLVRSEHAHASYPKLFFRPPGFSPYIGREERRVQELDFREYEPCITHGRAKMSHRSCRSCWIQRIRSLCQNFPTDLPRCQSSFVGWLSWPLINLEEHSQSILSYFYHRQNYHKNAGNPTKKLYKERKTP